MDKHQNIVFFDGVCGLCNSSVDFLIQKDTQRNLKYSPQQGDSIKSLDIHVNPENMESIIFYSEGNIYEKSRAVAAIASKLPYPWKLGSLVRFIPTFIADPIYNWIARNRYRWFGKKESCRLPTPEERAYFLD